MKSTFHIAIIEDNPFYNKMLCETFKMLIHKEPSLQNQKVNIHSFANPNEFLLNGRMNYNLIFLDYFFDNHHNANELIGPIKTKCDHVKIYLMSEIIPNLDLTNSSWAGIDGFISKDEETFVKCDAILMKEIN